MIPKNIAGPSLLSIPSNPTGYFELDKIIEVVASLPATPAEKTTYYVGAQTSIDFTDLDGDTDEHYYIEGFLIGGGGNDAMSMRINGISVNNYDWRYGYAGSTSNQTESNGNKMNLGSMQGLNAINHFGMNIWAKSGANRSFFWWMNTVGVSQQVVSLPSSGGGIWRNSVNNLTTIRFTELSSTNMYGVGTKFMLYKLKK